MRKLLDYRSLYADYASYHLTPGNRRCHAIGIPLIVFALTTWSQIGSPLPLTAVFLPLYFYWDARVGLLMTTFMAAGAGLGLALPGWTALAAFVVGWAFQLYGHQAFEKNKPALLDNLLHALVGPAFVATELAGLRRG